MYHGVLCKIWFAMFIPAATAASVAALTASDPEDDNLEADADDFVFDDLLPLPGKHAQSYC